MLEDKQILLKDLILILIYNGSQIFQLLSINLITRGHWYFHFIFAYFHFSFRSYSVFQGFS
jgi:hypothetical protein